MKLLQLALSLLAIAPACAQKTFEVASIKPNATGDRRVMMRIMPGGRFTATGVTVKNLITEAYGVADFQVSGGPGWIEADHYDINAKAEGEGNLSRDDLRAMVRALLAERFGLKTHTDSKEMTVYALVVGKNGPKLTPSTAEKGSGSQMRMGRGLLDVQKAPMAMLAQVLSRQLGRTVVDKTGLTGSYDFKLEWTPEPGQGPAGMKMEGGPGEPMPAADTSGPSIFNALQDQLGLRLESQKGPVEMIVIDQVSKPSEN